MSYMINLFEYMNEKTTDLIWAFSQSGINNQSVIIYDNGWLSDDMVSPFSFYTSAYENKQGHALFFNEIPVKSFWGIRGNDQLAEVYDTNVIRAKIFYHSNREVERVEWWDENEQIQFIDHYNRYGHLYAKTYYHRNNPVQKSYYSLDNFEIINHNLVTNQIMLQFKNRKYIFDNLVEFVLFFIKENFNDTDYSRIIYDSLSTPLFVISKLQDKTRATLIWDEPLNGDVPGNMVNILSDYNSNTKRILFQRKNDMRKIQNNHHFSRSHIVSYLGKLYNFIPKNNVQEHNALIVTNSDSIWNLEKLVQLLPQLHFKIMALTEMSSKLMLMEKYDNVELVPSATPESIKENIVQATYLLDINNGSEVLNVIKESFLSHTLILSAQSVTHNLNYVLSDNIFSDTELIKMVDKLNLTLNNESKYHEAVLTQENIFGPTGDTKHYLKALEDF